MAKRKRYTKEFKEEAREFIKNLKERKEDLGELGIEHK